MNDPHVVWLQYRDETPAFINYVNPSSVSWDNTIFDVVLSDGILTCTMKQHFDSIPDALDAVEPYLRSWKVETALRLGRDELQFTYHSADLIDRNPPPGNGISGWAYNMLEPIQASATAVLQPLTLTSYPGPPTRFRVNANVETMWQRYQGYIAGREPLQSMAYFCLTVIENDAGTRRKAAMRYDIDDRVLSKLGQLTSTKGDHSTSRKMTGGTSLTNEENRWIEAAVKVLILRMGEYDPQNPMPLLMM